VAVVVIPGVIEEGHAFVDGGVHDADGFVVIFDGANVPAAEAEDGDALAGAAEDAGGKAGGRGAGCLGQDLLCHCRHG